MNHNQSPYLDSPHSMAAGSAYGAHQATAGSLASYPPYQHQTQHHPVLPGPGQYAQSSAASYGHATPQYSYAGGIPSPHSAGQLPSHLTTPGLPPLPNLASTPQQNAYVSGAPPTPTSYPPPVQQTANLQQALQDPTGQTAPSGMKPRVTATLWEDEGAMCFQVETKGICVARRDDNHMINGTKLLNVAGMTRGRRDGILKSEKQRTVVKIGPMHLKGVWIPFDRALEFANKEKITDSLYPLFVHNIGALLQHPANQNRHTQAVTAHQERRRLENQRGGGQPGSHAGAGTGSSSVSSTQSQPPPAPGSLAAAAAAAAAAGRSGLDRSNTFPTPPTSASGTLAGLGSQPNAYDWSGHGMASAMPTAATMGAVESHGGHSTPATPATTPPGAALPSMNYSAGQPLYSTDSSGGLGKAYSSQGAEGYMKQQQQQQQDMGPPRDHHGAHQSQQQQHQHQHQHSHHHAGGEEHHHHQGGYSHHRAYDAYGVTPYTAGPHAGGDDDEHHHPHHHGHHAHAHGHAADEDDATRAGSQQWGAGGVQGYQTPPQRAHHQVPPGSGGSASYYPAQTQHSGGGGVGGSGVGVGMNGLAGSKRMRAGDEDDDDDDDEEQGSAGMDMLKRQKLVDGGASARQAHHHLASHAHPVSHGGHGHGGVYGAAAVTAGSAARAR